MADKDPEYIETSRGRIATRCRICGKTLVAPSEMKKEVHKWCDDNRTGSVHTMRG
jgi:ribosomal protein S27E